VVMALACQARPDTVSDWSDEPADPQPGDPQWSGAPEMVAVETTRLHSDPPAALCRVAEHPGWARRAWHVLPGPADVLVLTSGGWMGQKWVELTAKGDVVTHRSVLRPRGLLGQVYAATVWPLRRHLLHRRIAGLLAQ
jgi:hypothetical protein